MPVDKKEREYKGRPWGKGKVILVNQCGQTKTCTFAKQVKKIFLFVSLVLMTGSVGAYDTVRTNLSKAWQAYNKETGFSNFSGNKKVVHLQLSNESNDFIEIEQKHLFSVFLNDKLCLTNQTKIVWPIDSLKSVYASGLRISIFSKHGVKSLATYAVLVAEDQNRKTELDHFRNVMITVSIILAAALVILFRTSLQSTLEYFNVGKVFSVRNIDEGAVTTRVTSVNNVFFYIFCSAVIAINLFIFSRQAPAESSTGFSNYLINILYLMGLVFLILTLKIVVVSLSAWLFRLSEFAPGQFYNFVRLLLVEFSISSIILLINFMLGGNSESAKPFLIVFIVSLLLVFTMITFAKLNSRGGFTVFHLFSYLCASEIIPLVILLNIYFS